MRNRKGMVEGCFQPFFARVRAPERVRTVTLQSLPSLPTMTEKTARRPKIILTAGRLPRLAALLIVAAGIGTSQAVAWDHDTGRRAVTLEPGFPVPPEPLQDPLVPVLPGGMVGPELGAGARGAPKTAPPHSAHRPDGDAAPGGRQSPVMPPSAGTREQAIESRAHLVSQETPDEIDGGRIRRRIGIALGLAGIIGIVAVMAAVRGTKRRQELPSPLSVLRDDLRPPRDRGQRGGPRIRPPLTPGSA